MASARERVYALHDFDAENPDEVSFKAGETVIVVEKDDAYGDGWWQVRCMKNVADVAHFFRRAPILAARQVYSLLATQHTTKVMPWYPQRRKMTITLSTARA